MKKYILLTLITILFSNIAFANLPPRPTRCPGELAIKNYGVSKKTMQIDDLWIAARRHFVYDTSDLWSFIVGNIAASDTNDAYIKATNALNSIVLMVGPFLDDQTNHWVCMYSTADGYPAITVNPPLVVPPFDKAYGKYLKR